jgi:hypothetical protein
MEAAGAGPMPGSQTGVLLLPRISGRTQACKPAAQGAGERGEGRSGGDAVDSPCTQGPAHEQRRCAQSTIDANPKAFTKVLIGQGPGAALGRHLA